MRAFALTQSLWLRAGLGDTATALRGYREVVETWYRGGDWANQWLSLRQLAGVLASAGRAEQPALLFGAVSGAGATTTGRASCRESVCQYALISVVAATIKK